MQSNVPRQKPLEWVASAKKDLLTFPETARRNIGYALGLAQLGGRYPEAKAWRGDGQGVFEVVESFEDNAFRAVYTVRFEKAIYVLHRFRKKSPTGIRTAKTDVDLIHERLLRATRHYEAHYGSQD